MAYECLETIAEAEHWVLALLHLPPGVLEEAPHGVYCMWVGGGVYVCVYINWKLVG